MYAALTLRPDISHAAKRYSLLTSKAIQENLVALKKVMVYLKETKDLKLH